MAGGTTWDGGATTWDAGLTLWDGATPDNVTSGGAGVWLWKRKKAKAKDSEEIAAVIAKQAEPDLELAQRLDDAYGSIYAEETQKRIAAMLVQKHQWQLQQAQQRIAFIVELQAKFAEQQQRIRKRQEDEFFLLYM